MGERWGYHRNILIGLVGGGIGAMILFLTHNIWIFAGIYFLTGICLATMSPAIGAITCTKVNEDFRGRAYGLQQSAGTFGALASALLASQIAALLGYGGIFLFVSLLFLVGAFVFKTMLKRWPMKN